MSVKTFAELKAQLEGAGMEVTQAQLVTMAKAMKLEVPTLPAEIPLIGYNDRLYLSVPGYKGADGRMTKPFWVELSVAEQIGRDICKAVGKIQDGETKAPEGFAISFGADGEVQYKGSAPKKAV